MWMVGSDVLGHNSLGLVPQVLAWTLALSGLEKRAGVGVRLRVSPDVPLKGRKSRQQEQGGSQDDTVLEDPGNQAGV